MLTDGALSHFRKGGLRDIKSRSLWLLLLVLSADLAAHVGKARYLSENNGISHAYSLVDLAIDSGLIIFDASLSFIVGVVSAVYFFNLVAKKVDKDFKDYLQNQTFDIVCKLSNVMHKEYVPEGHFAISFDTDQRFWRESHEDFATTTLSFYSGVNGQLQMVRLFQSDNQELRRMLLRLPLSHRSMRKAVEIRRKLNKVYLEERHYSENYFVKTDTTEYQNVKRRIDELETFESLLLHVVSAAIATACYAFLLTKSYNVEIAIRDWDETASFRIEFMDKAVYIGNYALTDVSSRFSPGTSKFLNGSFMHRIMKPGILEQIESCFSSEDFTAKIKSSRKDEPYFHRPAINTGKGLEFGDLKKFLASLLDLNLEDQTQAAEAEKFIGLTDLNSSLTLIKDRFAEYCDWFVTCVEDQQSPIGEKRFLRNGLPEGFVARIADSKE